MFFQLRIIDVVFLILIRIFLEKFCSLCYLISYLGVCHNELHQNRYCLLVTILVIVYYLCLVVFFPPMFPVFLRRFTGMYVFSSFVVRLLHVDFLCFFLYSCRNLVHIQQEFLNIVFSRVI